MSTAASRLPSSLMKILHVFTGKYYVSSDDYADDGDVLFQQLIPLKTSTSPTHPTCELSPSLFTLDLTTAIQCTVIFFKCS